ncbi:MAG TPA: hydantoinase/oxoprolinase family protein [Xanthobacteraceae bacterium]
MTLRLGLDVGGTFTDLVLVDENGAIAATKAPTTHDDLIVGLFEGLGILAGAKGWTTAELLSRVGVIVHGTTVATNAVLTETGARTGLITTRGFRDILAMRRGIREVFYDNKYKAPHPLVPRYLRQVVTERVTVAGEVLTPIALDDVKAACALFARENIEAVAICFMHSYKHPEHEALAAEVARRELPHAFVTASHEVLPAIRLYDRVSTTVFNAYTGPIVHRYLSRLEHALREQGFNGALLIMQSNGGVTSPAEAVRAPARLILSGPAAGPAAGIAAAGVLGFSDLAVCDAGGTSFEVSLIQNGQPFLLREQDVDRRRLALPALGIHTIGAGGGSIAWVDGGGLLHVGPQSAGSNPGPACYGRGGTEPTATDAALLLGYLDPDYFLGGRMPLYRDKAEAAVGRVATQLGLDLAGASRGIYDVISANMAAGIQAVTVQRGHDPRDFLLVAGGGAGPLFACRIAQELQIPAILVPRLSATLCAWGVLQADLMHDDVSPLHSQLSDLDASAWSACLAGMKQRGDRLLQAEGVPPEERRFTAAADLRYAGQYDDITVTLAPDEWDARDLSRLLQRFHRMHDDLNGYSSPEHPCEVSALHLTSTGLTDKTALPALAAVSGEARPVGTRTIWTEANPRTEAPVYALSDLPFGQIIHGPAIVELPGSTLVLLAGFDAGVDSAGNLLAFLATRQEFAARLAQVTR